MFKLCAIAILMFEITSSANAKQPGTASELRFLVEFKDSSYSDESFSGALNLAVRALHPGVDYSILHHFWGAEPILFKLKLELLLRTSSGDFSYIIRRTSGREWLEGVTIVIEDKTAEKSYSIENLGDLFGGEEGVATRRLDKTVQECTDREGLAFGCAVVSREYLNVKSVGIDLHDRHLYCIRVTLDETYVQDLEQRPANIITSLGDCFIVRTAENRSERALEQYSLGMRESDKLKAVRYYKQALHLDPTLRQPLLQLLKYYKDNGMVGEEEATRKKLLELEKNRERPE